MFTSTAVLHVMVSFSKGLACKMIWHLLFPGMKNRQKMIFHGEGDQAPGLQPGDIIIILEQKEHPVFQRKDNDLVMKLEISLADALCGCKQKVQTLDGRTILITSQPGECFLVLLVSCSVIAFGVWWGRLSRPPLIPFFWPGMEFRREDSLVFSNTLRNLRQFWVCIKPPSSWSVWQKSLRASNHKVQVIISGRVVLVYLCLFGFVNICSGKQNVIGRKCYSCL